MGTKSGTRFSSPSHGRPPASCAAAISGPHGRRRFALSLRMPMSRSPVRGRSHDRGLQRVRCRGSGRRSASGTPAAARTVTSTGSASRRTRRCTRPNRWHAANAPVTPGRPITERDLRSRPEGSRRSALSESHLAPGLEEVMSVSIKAARPRGRHLVQANPESYIGESPFTERGGRP